MEYNEDMVIEMEADREVYMSDYEEMMMEQMSEDMYDAGFFG